MSNNQSTIDPAYQAMLDTGFIMVPATILCALADLGLNNREFKIVAFIFQKTFGFHKTFDWIALSQFVEATGIAKNHVSEILKKLVAREILIRRNFDDCIEIGINPALIGIGQNTEAYKKCTKTGVPKTGLKSPNSGNHNKYSTKDNAMLDFSAY